MQSIFQMDAEARLFRDPVRNASSFISTMRFSKRCKQGLHGLVSVTRRSSMKTWHAIPAEAESSVISNLHCSIDTQKRSTPKAMIALARRRIGRRSNHGVALRSTVTRGESRRGFHVRGTKARRSPETQSSSSGGDARFRWRHRTPDIVAHGTEWFKKLFHE
jgi:hypothetical protein